MPVGAIVAVAICGAGVVAAVTYIVCLLSFDRKEDKGRRPPAREVYEVDFDDNRDDDSLYINIKR